MTHVLALREKLVDGEENLSCGLMLCLSWAIASLSAVNESQFTLGCVRKRHTKHDHKASSRLSTPKIW